MSRLTPVRYALAHAGLLLPDDTLACETLSGGLTNDNVLATIHRGGGDRAVRPRKVVVRRFRATTSKHLRYDRTVECTNARMAAQGGAGPDVLGFVPASEARGDGGVLVIDFVSGATLDEADVQGLCSAGDEGTRRLVDALLRLHLGPAFPHDFDPCTARKGYEDECRKLDLSSRQGRPIASAMQASGDAKAMVGMWLGFHEVAAQLAPLQAKLESLCEPKVPCHNDLLAANFIATPFDGVMYATNEASHKSDSAIPGPLMLIDYELSGMSTASWELGNIISENGVEGDPDAVSCLVEQYWRSRQAQEQCRTRDCDSAMHSHGGGTSPQSGGAKGSDSHPSWLESRVARARAWSLVSKVTWAAWGRVMYLLAAAHHDVQGDDSITEHEKDSQAPRQTPPFDYAQWSLAKLENARIALSDPEELSRLTNSLRLDELDQSGRVNSSA